jgi:hypothetical protein
MYHSKLSRGRGKWGWARRGHTSSFLASLPACFAAAQTAHLFLCVAAPAVCVRLWKEKEAAGAHVATDFSADDSLRGTGSSPPSSSDCVLGSQQPQRTTPMQNASAAGRSISTLQSAA